MRRLFIVLLLCTAGALWSQTFRGGVQGTVFDSTGAALPGAQVTVTNPSTGFTRIVQTDSAGEFSVTELPVGIYKLTTTKDGFSTVTSTGIRVDVAAVPRVTITLQPGEVKQSVEVQAEVPLVDATSETVGGTIEADRVEQLPINGRDFTKLLVLVPGATGDASGSTDSPGSFGLFSINGNRGRSNNYLLDGTDMNDGYRNLPAINEAGVFGTPATLLPVDALAEVPVMSEAEAEYGRNSGAIVNLVTKSGTNDLHGSLYEFFRNDALDARNFFNTSDQAKDKFRNNQFGGSLGGPIIKDRTFWFVAYEGQRERVGLPFVNEVPTQQQIQNTLATLGQAPNPIAMNILGLNPWTQGAALPATGALGTNIQQAVNASNRVDSLIVKIDHHLGGHDKHDLLTGRYFFGDSDQSFPLALLAGGAVPGYNTVTPTRVQVLSLSYTHVISPKMLLELRGGYNRFAESFSPQDQSLNPASVGLNTVSNPQDFGLPLIKIDNPCPDPNNPQPGCGGSFAPIGSNAGNPRGRVDTNWQLLGNMGYNSGRHNMKWGYEFRRTFVNGFFDAGYRGVMHFASLADFLTGTRAGGGSHAAIGDSHRGTFQNNDAFYFQDDFRLTSRLTFNYGLRWDYLGVIGEEKNRLSILSPDGNSLTQVGTNGLSSLYPRDLNNFAPRLGLAWDVTGSSKTVVRAGWGVYYDDFSQDFFVGQLPFNTFNPGPAYNGVGPSPINFTFHFTINPVACGTAGSIPIPNSTLCAPPAFVDFFGTDVFTVDQKIRTPYVQVYNLNVQRQLTGNSALQVGYVGSQGRKLFRYVDINQFDPSLNGGQGGFPFPNFTYVNQFQSSAASNYNALQIALNFRNFHGLSSTTDYTWSHSIDNASDGQDYVPNASQPDNSRNPAAERANSNFDTRHRFTWNWAYDLPSFGRDSRWAKGWAISGVLTLASGQPYNVSWINSFNNDFNGSGEFYGRPDLVGNPFAGVSTPFNYLNLSAFAVPCNFDPTISDCSATNPNKHFGSLGRNAFVGPHYRNFDFSLSKRTQISERLNLELRGDFFNIFNHPNFSNPLLPNFSVDMTQNGIASNGRGIGFLPLTATPDVGIGNPFLGGGGPRNIQLAMRFSF